MRHDPTGSAERHAAPFLKDGGRAWILAAGLAAGALLCVPNALAQQPGAAAGATSQAGQASAGTITQTTSTKPAKPVSPKRRRDAERAYVTGAKALENNDPRTALENFEYAVELDPENTRYLGAREVARQHIVTTLVQEAEQARIAGKTQIARDKLSEALAMDPTNPIALQHESDLRGGSVFAGAKPDDSIDLSPPVELTPQPGNRDFHMRTNSVELIRRVMNSYGITPIIDESVRRNNLKLDVDNLDFAQASELLKLLTDTFFVPLDPRRVLVARDSKDNRQRYERLAMETIYMPGLTTTEMTDMSNIARNLFEIPVEVVEGDKGTLRVRGPAERLKALNATFSDLLEGRSQVALDVKLFTIDRSSVRSVGIQLPQQTTIFSVSSEVNNIIQNNQSLVNQIISSGLASAGDTTAIAAILLASGAISSSILSQPFALFGGGLTATGLSLGSVSANLSLNSSDARTLDDVSLSVADQNAATFRSGTRYPIITSTYSGIASSGINIPGLSTSGLSSTLASLGLNASAIAQAQQTTPQIQYEDLGLTLKVTPHIQMGKSVALLLDMQVESLGGNFLNNIPVLNRTQYSGTITLKNGESAVVVSDMNRSQIHAVSGIPGLSELPGLHGTNSNVQTTDSNLIILITPRITRLSAVNPNSRLVTLPYHE